MSDLEAKTRLEDDKILKDLAIEAFTKWSSENPAARTIQASAERLPTLSNSTFGRIIDPKHSRGATLDEAIEILTLTNHLELLDHYMKQSTSDSAKYLRMLKNKTGEQVKVDLTSTDPIMLMNAINDGFAQTKAELKRKELLIERSFGMMLGALICGFVVFYYMNFNFFTHLWEYLRSK